MAWALVMAGTPVAGSEGLTVTGVAVVLAGLSIWRQLEARYATKQEYITSRQAVLDQHRLTAKKLAGLKLQVAQLEEQRQQVDKILFTGASEEEIASAVQLLVQEKLNGTGLETESLRPVLQQQAPAKDKADAKKKGYGEISVKARLSGTLDGFSAFLANLYRTDKLFRVESFSIKAYKGTGLKIFIDINGYYKLA
jgi:Tfp pilus assembly protein PilO